MIGFLVNGENVFLDARKMEKNSLSFLSYFFHIPTKYICMPFTYCKRQPQQQQPQQQLEEEEEQHDENKEGSGIDLRASDTICLQFKSRPTFYPSCHLIKRLECLI